MIRAKWRNHESARPWYCSALVTRKQCRAHIVDQSAKKIHPLPPQFATTALSPVPKIRPKATNNTVTGALHGNQREGIHIVSFLLFHPTQMI